MLNELIDDIKRNRFSYVALLIVTLFFVYQHTHMSWDFLVYQMNGEWMFGDKYYFEWERAPLLSFSLGLFDFIFGNFGKYLLLVTLSIIFFYVTRKLSDVLEVDFQTFYLLMLTPFFINYATSVGTEILTLIFLELMVIFILKKDSILSGISFGLMFLTRYTSAIFVILSLFHKRPKDIIKFGLFAFLIIVPWFLYNFYHTGNPLTSFSSSISRDVLERGYFDENPRLMDFLIVLNFVYIPIFLLQFYNKGKNLFSKKDLLMLTILIISIVIYVRTPMKVFRYMFTIILPVAYFVSVYLSKLKIDKRRVIILLLIGLNVIGAFVLHYKISSHIFLDKDELYLHELNGINCMVKSDIWVYLNYNGIESYPAPFPQTIQKDIDNGYRIVLYKPSNEPSYSNNFTFLSQYNILSNASRYLILGDESRCKDIKPVEILYLKEFYQNIGELPKVCAYKFLCPIEFVKGIE